MWNQLFHSRVDENSCRLAGWVRVGYSIIFLYDRMILGLDLAKFFLPSQGALPLHIGQDNPNITKDMFSIFELAPESDTLVWFMHYLGVAQALFLLLGVAPRLQVAGLFINILTFQNHNFLFWDEQDRLFRLWSFFLFFMPLHHITVFDGFGFMKQRNTSNQTSWPVWPFRLFQIQLTIIYLNLSLHKMETKQWFEGTALYYAQDHFTFGNGAWVQLPESIVNRMLPIQILTWTFMAFEIIAWVAIWLPGLRRITAHSLIAFHLATELIMNQHCFAWLAILGWSVVLFEKPETQLFGHRLRRLSKRRDYERHTAEGCEKKGREDFSSQEICEKNFTLQGGQNHLFAQYEVETRFITNLFLVAIITMFAVDALPIEAFERILMGGNDAISSIQWHLYSALEPSLCFFGLWQHNWSMYSDFDDMTSIIFAANLHRDHAYINDPSKDFYETEYHKFYSEGQLSSIWGRKRLARQLIYFNNLNEKSASKAWMALGESVANQQYRRPTSGKVKDSQEKGTVVGFELFAGWQISGEPLAPLYSWNKPLRDETNTYFPMTSLFKVRYCTNVIPQDKTYSDLFCNDCWADEEFVNRYCRAQCEVCETHFAELGHDYLSYPLSEYDEDECLNESLPNWDAEECPSYRYYVDFDLREPRTSASGM